jgi:hypothetical protein
VELHPFKYEARSSNPSAAKNQKKTKTKQNPKKPPKKLQHQSQLKPKIYVTGYGVM